MGSISSTYQSHGPFLSWSKLLLLTTQSTLTGLSEEGYITRDQPQKGGGGLKKQTPSLGSRNGSPNPPRGLPVWRQLLL